MPELAGHLAFRVEVSRLHDQRVRVLYKLHDIIGAAHVADVDVPRARKIRTEHVVRLDQAAIRQHDGAAPHKLRPSRSRRHAKRFGLFDQERAARLFLEYKSKIAWPPVRDRKRADRKIFVLEKYARFQIDQMDRHWRFVAAQYDAVNQIVDAI